MAGRIEKKTVGECLFRGTIGRISVEEGGKIVILLNNG
jgi:hypothetical protein